MEKTSDQGNVVRNRVLRSSAATMKPGAKIKIGPEPESAQPKIKINRNDQGVESIEVVCKCGERIVIRCEYA